MPNMLGSVPLELKGLIGELRKRSFDAGIKAYLVGGFVRDIILGFKNLDVDILVEGGGIGFAEDFAGLHKAKVTVHKHFGTATVVLPGGLKVDFSSARKEVYPSPGHLPVVSAGCLQDDLYRRDFTVNAMAIGLNDGILVDYFGGRQDLKEKKIRVLHSLSFRDDPTRILRGIRFEQRYGFKLEQKTLSLLKKAVRSGMLAKVHPHRMRDELILLLKEESPVKALKRVKQLAGFGFIHPKIKLSAGVIALLGCAKKEIAWFNRNYPQRRKLEGWIIYLCALLDTLSLREAHSACARLGLRKGDEKRLLSCKEIARASIAFLASRKAAPAAIFNLLEPLSYEAVVFLRSKYHNGVLRQNIAAFLEIYNGMRLAVSGGDLNGMGLSPGPAYQKIFAHVLTAKLNGEVNTREEELSLIRQLLKTGVK